MAFDYSSPFTFRPESPVKYKSIFTYHKVFNAQEESEKHPASEASLGERFATLLITAASYLLLVVTFPIIGWFCILRIRNWECIVQYRLGRLVGVRGPGRVVHFPWMDRYERCDLRLRSIMVPPVQCIAADGCVLTAGAEIHYRISRPLTYVSGVRDPGGHGLRSLAHVVALQILGKAKQKCTQDTEERRLMEREALERLNEALLHWGIEVETVCWQELQMICEAKPHNGLNAVLQQLGITPPTAAGNDSFLNLLTGNTMTPVATGAENDNSALKDVRTLVENHKATLDSWFGSNHNNEVLEVQIVLKDGTNKVYVQRQGFQVTILEAPPINCETSGTLKLQNSVLQDLVNGKTTIFQAYLQGLVVLVKNDSIEAANNMDNSKNRIFNI